MLAEPARPSAHTNHTSAQYRLNAKTWAKRFSARLLEPGIVSYEDMGCGKAYLSKQTIDRCINTFVGRPVIIKHSKTTPQNMKAVGHGYITHVKYNEADGWWYGEGVVDTDEAARAIQQDGFGSVGYEVTRAGKGGEYHGIPYHEEIQEFSGEHLAIVDNPRYEGATIRLNSKTNKNHNNMNVFKWIKKTVASASKPGDEAAPAAEQKPDETPAAGVRENAKPEDITPETEIEIAAGERVQLGQLVEAYNAKKNGGEIGEEDEVMVNGKAVKMNALINAYTKMCEKEDEEKKSKENAKGGSNFYRLLNARENAEDLNEIRAKSPDTLADRLARGNARYGSATTSK